MQIRFYANMRTIVGRTSLEVDDPSVDSLRRLISHLVDGYPQASSHLLDERGALRQDVPVFVDGRNPRLMQNGVDSPLHPDSIVSFFSPISSGRMNVEVLRD
jgi:molybdopterin converting factor small subunit